MYSSVEASAIKKQSSETAYDNKRGWRAWEWLERYSQLLDLDY